MTNQLFPVPPRAFDRNGEPLAGAKMYVYQSGTMTAVTVTDSGGTALPWPVIADLNGVFAQPFYAGAYDLKVIITDSADAIQPGYPLDPVAMAASDARAAEDVVFTPTAYSPSLDVQGALEDVSDALATLNARTITGTGLATGGGTLAANREINVERASAAEAEAGTENAKVMTPLRTAQAIAALTPLPKTFTSTDQTITTAGLLTLAHGLGRAPELVTLHLVCQTGENNWATGDVVQASANSTDAGGNRVNSIYWDATNVYVRFSDAAACFLISDKTTGAHATATNTNWKLRVRAWA